VVIPKRFTFIFIAVSVVTLGILVGLRFLFGEMALFVGVILAVVLSLVTSFLVYISVDWVQRRVETDYTQIEALLSVFTTLKPAAPLPGTRLHWSAAPDLLVKLIEILLSMKPELVVETGCGVSTIVIAHCLKALGRGSVISLEHDPEHLSRTSRYVDLHLLQPYVKLIHAPLKEVGIGHETWIWYDTDMLKSDLPIELLFVDGPPAGTRKYARYPAVPLLYDDLSEKAMVILDDGKREDERETAQRWTQEFGFDVCEYLPLEKGAFLLYNQKPDAP
jgi:predicted O-methyltransferase YrrM